MTSFYPPSLPSPRPPSPFRPPCTHAIGRLRYPLKHSPRFDALHVFLWGGGLQELWASDLLRFVRACKAHAPDALSLILERSPTPFPLSSVHVSCPLPALAHPCEVVQVPHPLRPLAHQLDRTCARSTGRVCPDFCGAEKCGAEHTRSAERTVDASGYVRLQCGTHPSAARGLPCSTHTKVCSAARTRPWPP